MLLKNTTDLPDSFLRNMVRWCCKQVGFKYADLTRADYFQSSTGSARGRAWFGLPGCDRILVRSNPDKAYPYSWLNHRGLDLHFQDRLAIMIYITGHELQHLVNWHTWVPGSRRGFVKERLHCQLVRNRDMEPHCVRAGKRVLDAFEYDRLSLTYSWST